MATGGMDMIVRGSATWRRIRLNTLHLEIGSYFFLVIYTMLVHSLDET